MMQAPLPLTAAIDARDISKSYGKIRAVSGVTFSLPKGGVLGLLGGNGAGKTTLIGMIMGLVKPTQGNVRVLGRDMIRERADVLPRMNFESPYMEMPHRLTVRQNLTVFARLYGISNPTSRVKWLADQFELGDLLDRETGRLSAGQKTRVAVAKALLNEPEVLVLDEPTASLDPETADWVRTRLEEFRIRTRASVLLASHNMAEVERLCDTILFLRRGEVVHSGAPRELAPLLGQSSLEDAFIALARG